MSRSLSTSPAGEGAETRRVVMLSLTQFCEEVCVLRDLKALHAPVPALSVSELILHPG